MFLRINEIKRKIYYTNYTINKKSKKIKENSSQDNFDDNNKDGDSEEEEGKEITKKVEYTLGNIKKRQKQKQ